MPHQATFAPPQFRTSCPARPVRLFRGPAIIQNLLDFPPPIRKCSIDTEMLGQIEPDEK